MVSKASDQAIFVPGSIPRGENHYESRGNRTQASEDHKPTLSPLHHGLWGCAGNVRLASVPCKTLRLTSIASFSVLTHCQFSGVPALLLTSYTDTGSPDSISMSGFRILFKFRDVAKHLSEVEVAEVKKRLRLLSAGQQKNNLFVWSRHFLKRFCGNKYF